MAIQYVDTNRQNTTFVPTNKQNLIDNIETVLLAAGWTTISGHGTTTLVMQSATTPQGLNMQIKVKDNSGTCVAVSVQNVAGTKVGNNSTTQGFQLNPGSSSKTYRMVANKYQAFIWTASPTPAREFAAWGVPYLPSFLNTVVTEAIWGCGNSLSDSSSTIPTSFRTRLDSVTPNVGGWCNTQVICNGNIVDVANGTAPGASSLGVLQISTPGNNSYENVKMYRWHDNSANLVDALIGWGLTTTSDEAKIRGQLWDAMLSSESYAGDLTTVADSHNWIVITDGNNGVGGQFARGALFIATP
jgi:hypothetical protein